jgi:hypothetical protein
MSADAEESLRARMLCGSHIIFGKVAESIAWPTKSSWIRSQLKAIGSRHSANSRLLARPEISHDEESAPISKFRITGLR